MLCDSATHGIEQCFSHFCVNLLQAMLACIRKDDIDTFCIIIGAAVLTLIYYIVKAIFAESTKHTENGACAFIVAALVFGTFYFVLPNLPFLFAI